VVCVSGEGFAEWTWGGVHRIAARGDRTGSEAAPCWTALQVPACVCPPAPPHRPRARNNSAPRGFSARERASRSLCRTRARSLTPIPACRYVRLPPPLSPSPPVPPPCVHASGKCNRIATQLFEDGQEDPTPYRLLTSDHVSVAKGPDGKDFLKVHRHAHATMLHFLHATAAALPRERRAGRQGVLCVCILTCVRLAHACGRWSRRR